MKEWGERAATWGGPLRGAVASERGTLPTAALPGGTSGSKTSTSHPSHSPDSHPQNLT